MSEPASPSVVADGSRLRPVMSIREANRKQITEAILETARRQLAADGAAGLSLRAIAREVGMSSSAIYRYFPSRDELLTKLIVEAYDALGSAAEVAESRVDRADLAGRFRAICRSVRRWAMDNEHQYFLIYGTPVPGYAAPTDTVAPATRVANLMLTLLVERASQPMSTGPSTDQYLDPAVAAAISPLRKQLPPEVADLHLIAGMASFSGLFGAVSFELTGQLHNVVRESKAARSAYFEALIDGWLAGIGLKPN